MPAQNVIVAFKLRVPDGLESAVFKTYPRMPDHSHHIAHARKYAAPIHKKGVAMIRMAITPTLVIAALSDLLRPEVNLVFIYHPKSS